MSGSIGRPMTVFSGRTNKRKDYADLDVARKRALVVACLKNTHCEMTPGQIREWIRVNNQIYLTNNEVIHHLRRLRTDEIVRHSTAGSHAWALT